MWTVFGLLSRQYGCTYSPVFLVQAGSSMRLACRDSRDPYSITGGAGATRDKEELQDDDPVHLVYF